MTDSDLLTPVLDERHDATGFDRPGNPWRLVFLTFFAGPLGAAYLFSLNFRKLGQRQHVAWCAPLFVVIAVMLFYGLQAGEEALAADEKRNLRLMGRFATLLPATGIAYLQSKRFRLFRFAVDDEEGPLLWHGIAAFALAFGVPFAIALALLSLRGEV